MVLSKQCPDGQPRSPGVPPKDLKVCAMTFQAFERQADRIAPALVLFLGLIASVATAGLGF